MNEHAPTLEEWRELYEAVIRFKEIAPWEWMHEIDIFGVQNPETGEIGFVSVMGNSGEYLAVAIYPGEKALYDFWDFYHAGPFVSPEWLLEIPQLQASLTSRQEIEPQDYATIKQLGLKFRGKQAWPCFRSHHPGFLPWFLEAGEGRFLRYALEQVVEVALRCKEHPSLLKQDNDESYLVRVPSRKGDKLIWEDRIVSVPPPEPEEIPITIDTELFESLEKLPEVTNLIEVDVFMMPSPVHEKGTRPFFPYILLVAESERGTILHTDIMQPLPSLHEMRGTIPGKIVETFVHIGVIPQTIVVSSDLVFDLLEPLAQELNIQLEQSDNLKAIDPAKEGLIQHFL